jgi:putative acetyltransferase
MSRQNMPRQLDQVLNQRIGGWANGPNPSNSPQPTPLAQPQYTLEELTPHSQDEILYAAKELLLEYGKFVTAQPSVATFCLGALEREAADLPQSYLDQGGGAIVAFLAPTPAHHQIGFVAWRSLPVPELTKAWELKRLWTRPEARGLGVGKGLVQAVFDRALAANKTHILLDTSPDAMPAACRLYRQMGFVECASYNGPPAEGIVYLSKTL